MGRIALLLAAIVCAVVSANDATAATKREQRAEIGQIARQARLAQRHGRARDWNRASAALQGAVTRLERLAQDEVDAEWEGILRRAIDLVTAAHADLAAAGVEMDWYRLPPQFTQFSRTAPESDTRRASRRDAVSFSRQVAPLLLARCGRCHVGDAKGGFSLATYAALMRGSAEAGRVLVPGGAEGSVIIDLVESGDMPRGGGSLTAEEISLLRAWIDQGAQFDGPRPQTPLRELVAAAGRATRSPTRMAADTNKADPSQEVRPATGSETVRFALELAPVLSGTCLECHGNENPRGQLNLTTFARLLEGGASGSLVVPGDPDNSILIQRLKGEGGDRMPLNREPLSPATIARFETWVREGARFDGASATDPLARTTALARAQAADEEELNRMREELAERNWRLAIPDEQPQRVARTRVEVWGNLPAAQLEALADSAEAQFDAIARVFEHPDEQPLVKSRLTIFALERRFDYSEFGTMVERRELPGEWRGHWGYDGVDAYAVVFPADDDQFSNEVLLAQQIAGLYVAAQTAGRAPRWLAEGAARSAAARLDRRDPRVRGWQDAVARVLAAQKQPDDFMTGRLGLEEEGVLAYAFVDRLMTRPGRFQQLLAALARGKALDEALTQSYGANAAQLAAAWGRSLSRAR